MIGTAKKKAVSDSSMAGAWGVFKFFCVYVFTFPIGRFSALFARFVRESAGENSGGHHKK